MNRASIVLALLVVLWPCSSVYPVFFSVGNGDRPGRSAHCQSGEAVGDEAGGGRSDSTRRTDQDLDLIG